MAGEPGRDLIGETPEALRFVDETIRELKERYGDRFAFHSGVVWTGTPTAEGEVCGGEDPVPLVEDINKYGLLTLDEHDLTLPVGWSFRAQLFQTPEGQARFAVVVGGRYTPGTETTLADALGMNEGRAEPVLIALSPLPSGPYIQVLAHHRELDIGDLERLLADAPPNVKRKVKREFRHSEGISVEQLTIAVPMLLFVYPYAKRFAEKLAEEHHEWWKVVERRAIGYFSSRDLKRPLFVLTTPYRGCCVEFVVKSSSSAVLEAAMEMNTRARAAQEALCVIEYLHTRGIDLDRMLYEYDIEAKAWGPLYATRTDGTIITDRRGLIVARELGRGLSLAGTY